MKYNQDQQKILELFNNIPKAEILRIAQEYQPKIKTDKSLSKQKDNDQGWVTKADILIQDLLIRYFKNSKLKFKLVAEEEVAEDFQIDEYYKWQLLIDPLDGTHSYLAQSNIWGSMVGLCDKNGELKYSWNLLSTGQTYTSWQKKTKSKTSFKKMLSQGKKITIDIYDFHLGKETEFIKQFGEYYGVNNTQLATITIPSAVWTGGEVLNNNIAGLLWLPNTNSNKYFPSYDLIFLKALAENDFKIIRSEIGKNNAVIAVGPTWEDVENLYTIGLNLLDNKTRNLVKRAKNTLNILD